jgi:hypothetical protein
MGKNVGLQFYILLDYKLKRRNLKKVYSDLNSGDEKLISKSQSK